MEVNPRHPITRELLSKIKAFEANSADAAEGDEVDAEGDAAEGEGDAAAVEVSAEEQTVIDMTRVLVDSARIRSGFQLADQVAFSQRLERMLRLSLGGQLLEDLAL